MILRSSRFKLGQMQAPNVPLYTAEPNCVILLPVECYSPEPEVVFEDGCISPIMQLPKVPVYSKIQSYVITLANDTTAGDDTYPLLLLRQ